MSKFCGVISAKAVAKVLEYPLSFNDLNQLADWLISEAEQLDEDFATKSQFMQEQQEQILENEQNFLDMHADFTALNDAIVKLEMGVQENSAGVCQLEQAIKMLELMHPDISQMTKRRYQYDAVLELLEKTDKSMMYLSSLLTDILEYEQCLQLRVNPYNTIAAILECHNKSLTQTENNIDLTMDRTTMVDELYLQLMEKLSTSRKGAV